MTTWVEMRIGEAFTTLTGTTPPTTKAHLYGDYIPFVKPPELTGAKLDTAADYLSREGASVARIAPQGSVLISCIGNLAKIGLNTVSVAFNQQINAVLPNANVALPKFIFYQAQSPMFRAQMEALASGTTIPIVNKSKFDSLKIRLPTLSEQERIVAILDQAFDAIDAAETIADRNALHAQQLLGSYIGEAFEQVSPRCAKRRLGDIIERLTNGYVGPTRNIYHDEGVPYLLARHVKSNTLTFDGRTYVTKAFNQKHNKSMLKAGDVLLVQSGHIGHSAVVPPEHEGHNCHAMIVITPTGKVLDGEFLSWYFSSPKTQQEFKRIRTGSTVPHLNCGNVIEMFVPVPPIAMQREIASRIDVFRASTLRLGRLYLRKSAAMESLRNASLSAAFSARL